MVATGSGTHELLAYRLAGLPFQSTGGPGDHIDRDAGRRSRAVLSRAARAAGRWRYALSRDGRRALVANYLLNSVQVVDLERPHVGTHDRTWADRRSRRWPGAARRSSTTAAAASINGTVATVATTTAAAMP